MELVPYDSFQGASQEQQVAQHRQDLCGAHALRKSCPVCSTVQYVLGASQCCLLVVKSTSEEFASMEREAF